MTNPNVVESQSANAPAPSARRPEQPYAYKRNTDFHEPDWRRLPGYRDVSVAEWESAVWQRKNTVKNLEELSAVFGDLFPADLLADIDRDQRETATMSILVPPQMLNVMNEKDLWHDPIRLYMLPAQSDRHKTWSSHPMAQRDSLHEADMWAVEGLTHRYPTKVLAELLSTCPQYCGHCTRMDLVGNDVPAVKKHRFQIGQKERYELILDYLRKTPTVRDVVISGGDIANLPIAVLENFVSQVLDIENIRDIRLASKGLQAMPQHFLQDSVLAGLERIAKKAWDREVDIAVHTHVNHASQVTPLVARAVRKLHELGFRDVRNQGVMMRGINSTSHELLDLCFALQDHAHILPYYFYMCDVIPSSEHWRLSVAEARTLQHDIMGYLPGFATPRIVCDVPYVGKRWINQLREYDRLRGVSLWTKNYRTSVEADTPDALERMYPYYDPVYTLPEEGQAWWREHGAEAAKAGSVF